MYGAGLFKSHARGGQSSALYVPVVLDENEAMAIGQGIEYGYDWLSGLMMVHHDELGPRGSGGGSPPQSVTDPDCTRCAAEQPP